MELNFEKDRAIDPRKLDEEWLRQADLSWQYGKEEAEALKKVDQLKNEVEVLNEELKATKADVRLKIASDPEQYGITKATNDNIEAGVETNEDVEMAREHLQKKKAELTEVQYEYNLAHAARCAICYDRREALGHAQQLLMLGYYGDPKQLEAQGDLNEVINGMEKFAKKESNNE